MKYKLKGIGDKRKNKPLRMKPMPTAVMRPVVMGEVGGV